MRIARVLRPAAAVLALALIGGCNEAFLEPDKEPFANTTLSVIPGATNASGTGTTTFERPGEGLKYIEYKLILNNVTGITNVHLHQDVAGPDDPVMIHIYDGSTLGQPPTGTINGTFVHSNFAQSELSPAMTLDELHALIAAGQVYMDVHTETNPTGELRGVLTAQ